MLPSWRDRVSVEFSPHCITWVRLSRGLRPALLAKGVEQVVAQPEHDSWHAPLEVLKDRMQANDWKGAELTIVLSNHFVHYDCLPWNEAIKNENELLALARHRMTSVYGPEAQSWELRLSPAAKGESRVVAAVEGALVQALKESVAGAGISLQSVQPCLMACFNSTAKQLAMDDGWFVIAEPGRFALAQFQGGRWQRIHLRRGEGIDALHDWLERENMTSNQEVPDREVFLFAPGLARDASLPSYLLHWLELPACDGYSPVTDTTYAIAMSGVA